MERTVNFWGKVIHGKKRGRLMGFPTVNMNLHKNIPEGIYISKIKIEKKLYNSITFIGSAKTFGEEKITAETYIFSFTSKVYGSFASVRILKKIRNNEKFKSVKELQNKMEEDKKIAEEFFNTYV